MTKKLTPWFSDRVRPHHIGYYETKWLYGSEKTEFRYWDGEFWRLSRGLGYCSLQCYFWRGLAKKP